MAPDIRSGFVAETMVACLIALVAVAAVTGIGGLLGSATAGFGAAAVAMFVGAITGTRAFRQAVVAGPNWEYEGVRLEGDGLALVQDIGARFEYAEQVMSELPSAVGRLDFRADADALLWDAAGHAARMSDIDRELLGLRYAADGSAGAVLRADLTRSRSAHQSALRGIQREAEEVARAAGEAAAAATLAERTGSVYELDIAAPGSAELIAPSGLAAAKQRLKLAAEVWAELDETTKIRQGEIEQERRRAEG